MILESFPPWNKPDCSGLTPYEQEKPGDDPRQQTDEKNTKQTDKPWNRPVEKEQRSDDAPKPDLEKWHNTGTH